MINEKIIGQLPLDATSRINPGEERQYLKKLFSFYEAVHFHPFPEVETILGLNMFDRIYDDRFWNPNRKPGDINYFYNLDSTENLLLENIRRPYLLTDAFDDEVLFRVIGEEKMNKEINPKTKIEFFYVEGEMAGIGAENYSDREWFPLIPDEFENED